VQIAAVKNYKQKKNTATGSAYIQGGPKVDIQ